MEKIFFITAMLFNAETLELEPKFNQSVWFYNRINCEAYVQSNFTILHEGLQLYLDMEGDEREIAHTLKSILIDPNGLLVSSYPGDNWLPKEVEKNIIENFKFAKF